MFGICDCRISVNDQVNREIGENEIRNKEKVPNCYKQDGPRLNKHVPRSQVLERGVILIMKTDLGFENFNRSTATETPQFCKPRFSFLDLGSRRLNLRNITDRGLQKLNLGPRPMNVNIDLNSFNE